MAKAPISKSTRPDPLEPRYDVDPQTGAAIEVFYADDLLAKSFGTRIGWHWWTCRRGFQPSAPTGPFPTSYAAYRNVASPWTGHVPTFGLRRTIFAALAVADAPPIAARDTPGGLFVKRPSSEQSQPLPEQIHGKVAS
jgi:hypothetical protein